MKRSITPSSIRKIIIVAVWIGIWQLVYIGVGKDILIPAPVSTFTKLFKMIQEKIFYHYVIHTIYRVCMGVLISFILGVTTALLSYLNKLIREFLHPLIVVIQSTPVMAVIILALLWVNSSYVPILVCFLMCYPIVYTNVLTGLGSVDFQLIEMTKVYQVKRKHIIKDIYMPHISDSIKAALNLSVGLAWKVVIAAEVLAVPTYSMGYNLLSAKVYLETQEVFAWVIVIVLLSSLFEKLISRILGSRKKA